MGIATWTSANRITESPLSRIYTRERVLVAPNAYATKCVRNTKKRFRYVGLSASACSSCVAALERRYRRWIISWSYDAVNYRMVVDATRYPMVTEEPISADYFTGREPIICATIASMLVGPDLYDVSVDLNEDVPLYPNDPAVTDSTLETLFATYYGSNVWQYDED